MNLDKAESWIISSHAWLTARTSKARAHAYHYRVSYTALALLIFLTGLVTSLLSLQWDEIEIRPLLIVANILFLAPLTIALKAISLQTAGRIVDQELTFKSAFGACALATVSNVLPIPAGTAIQSAALIKKGATLRKGGGVIIFGNIVSLAIVLAVLGVSLSENGHPIGTIPLSLGLGLLCFFSFLVIRVSCITLAAYFMAIRIARILLMILRVYISFLAIGVGIQMTQAASFTGAIVLGSATVVAPAGLGVSEALAALIAAAVSVSPPAAFVAVALNRLITLFVAGIFTASTLNFLKRDI